MALKLMIVSQVVGDPVEPAVMVNDPAESVEPAVTVAEGPVPPPQLVGVPIVGAVVWLDRMWPLRVMSPEPAWIVTAELLLVEPIVMVWTPELESAI